MRKVHLNKSGRGMFAETACGRDILRTPLSVEWNEFKEEPNEYKCVKCAVSKQADLNTRKDVEKFMKEHFQVVHIGGAEA